MVPFAAPIYSVSLYHPMKVNVATNRLGSETVGADVKLMPAAAAEACEFTRLPVQRLWVHAQLTYAFSDVTSYHIWSSAEA